MRINSIYRSAFKANVAKFFNRSNIVEEKLYIKTEQHKKRIKKKHNDKTCLCEIEWHSWTNNPL